MCACHCYFWRHWRDAGLERLTMNPLPKYPWDKTPTAFPSSHENTTCTGMTLRDYFAAKAMQAIITNHLLEDCDDFVVAKNAYQLADFMLQERKT